MTKKPEATIAHDGRILIATDLSPCSQCALDYAALLAAKLEAHLDVLYVSNIPASLVGDAVLLRDRFVDADLREGRARVARIVAELRGRGLAVDGEAVAGYPSDVIVEKARACDLVVIGTHGRTGFRRLWIGSVAERVVRTSPTPVLTVRSSPTPDDNHDDQPVGADK